MHVVQLNYPPKYIFNTPINVIIKTPHTAKIQSINYMIQIKQRNKFLITFFKHNKHS